MRPQVEIVFREENTTAILCDERVGMSQFAAGIIQLEAGAPGKPHGRNATMIEAGREFVEPRDASSVGGD